MWLADGTLHDNNGSYSIRLSNSSSNVQRRFAKLALKVFNINASYSGDTVLLSSRELVRFWKHLNLVGTAREKKIPRWFLKASQRCVFSLLRGLTLDSHLISKKGTVAYGTQSLEMQEQLQTVLLNAGILTSRLHSNSNINLVISRQYAARFLRRIGFVEKHKAKKLSALLNRYDRQTEEPTFSGSLWFTAVKSEHWHGDVYDLAMPDLHEYVANGLLVHNTGRFSSAESWLEVSTNLQNLPKKQALLDPKYDVRRCVVPPAGYALVEADLSQAEARVVAALCNDKTLLDNWQNPEFDVHKWTASKIFNKSPEDVTKTERFLGKVARHALNYGMGWKTFQGNVNSDSDTTGISISAAEAKRIVKSYHNLHGNLEGWWKRVEHHLGNGGRLNTIFGRRRTFFGRRSADQWLDEVHKEAIAFEPQSTIADLLNRGMLRWWNKYDGKFGRLVAQVHDSVLIEVPAAKARGVARLLKKCLEEEITVNDIKLTIPADVSFSTTSWAEVEEL